MKSSPEPSRRAILLDANALSRLARVGRIELIPQVFPGRCYLSPAIYREIEAGMEAGVVYLEPVIVQVRQRGLRVLAVEEADRTYMASLPGRLALGEAEGIALCHRLGMVFVTHDRKAANFCDREGVRCLHFRTLVDTLQKRGLLTAEQAWQALE